MISGEIGTVVDCVMKKSKEVAMLGFNQSIATIAARYENVSKGTQNEANLPPLSPLRTYRQATSA